MSSISDNIKNVRKEIDEIAIKAGRNPDDITLLGVTKTVDIDVIEEAIEQGITEVGENKPQELKRKYEAIGDKVKWHQIGTLQTNKVKYIIDKAYLIHSLDRESLAEEINNRAEKLDISVNCLVQVNVSKEESKHGLDLNEVENFMRTCSEKYGNIKILGLMTMAPLNAKKDEIRDVFRKLKKVSTDISNLNIKNIEMRELSMGMSGDFDIAIEEGATIVRIGTSIFGNRNYENKK
ncbi:YggS family pyridoxal phosphate-dependent enzyme [Peptostreptococcus faecalis]|uniref:YggS family pyridoxal phosphate-dependent enzyme n=1 Tax=Peptostreptococcus faecalis TaxID=2045015 RepID=UPI000C7A67A5|nr:YggS family pyridoxal phosphate-dependent enzyme [Peptostreptococcus faecalis]